MNKLHISFDVELQMHGTDHLPTLCGAGSDSYIAFQFFHRFLKVRMVKEEDVCPQCLDPFRKADKQHGSV
jgi:hypothetical protein